MFHGQSKLSLPSQNQFGSTVLWAKNFEFFLGKMNIWTGVLGGKKSIGISFKSKKWPWMELEMYFFVFVFFCSFSHVWGYFTLERNSNWIKNLEGLSLIADYVACWIKLPTVIEKCHFGPTKKAKMAKNCVFWQNYGPSLGFCGRKIDCNSFQDPLMPPNWILDRLPYTISQIWLFWNFSILIQNPISLNSLLRLATWNWDEYFHFSSKGTLSRQKLQPKISSSYQIIDLMRASKSIFGNVGKFRANIWNLEPEPNNLISRPPPEPQYS